MASTARKFYTNFLLSLVLLLFFTWEVQGDLCQRLSTTWSGPCLDTEICKDQCINLEHATSGACGGYFLKAFYDDCFCSFKC